MSSYSKRTICALNARFAVAISIFNPLFGFIIGVINALTLWPVVVQICEREQGVVLYTCKIRNTQTRCFLPNDFADKYTNRIYVFVGV